MQDIYSYNCSSIDSYLDPNWSAHPIGIGNIFVIGFRLEHHRTIGKVDGVTHE